MMQIILVAAFLIAVATMACASPAATLESDSASSSQQPEASGPALLLDEESAISILQTYLQECVISWDEAYADQMARARVQSISMAERREILRRSNARLSAELEGTVFPTNTPRPTSTPDQLPQSEQQKKSWLMGLATGTTGDFVWSASYHGIAEVPNVYSRRGTAIESETWVVIGPGLKRAGSESATRGRWQVYAGHQRAHYLDAPARLALEEYDSFDSCP